MLQTIQTGSHISIQGEFVKRYDDGRVMVRVGKSFYVGRPMTEPEAPAETDLQAASA